MTFEQTHNLKNKNSLTIDIFFRFMIFDSSRTIYKCLGTMFENTTYFFGFYSRNPAPRNKVVLMFIVFLIQRTLRPYILRIGRKVKLSRVEEKQNQRK